MGTVDESAGKIGPHRRFAAIMHRLDLETILLVHFDDRHVRVRSGAVGADVDLLGFLRVGDEFGERFGAGLLAGHERQAARRHDRDEHKVLFSVVGDVFHQNAVHDHGRRDREHQRVAVGRGALGFNRRDRAGGTGLVLHDHVLAGLGPDIFAIGTREQIRLPSGRIAGDDLDLPGGPAGLRMSRRPDQRDRGGGSSAADKMTS